MGAVATKTPARPSEPPAEWVEPEALVPWPNNPRVVTDADVDAIAKSIGRFGFGSPIVARAENRQVISGHVRLRAATRLGLACIPVRYLHLSEEDAEALTLADNRLGELTSWSAGLGDVLRELDSAEVDLDGLGWSQDELEELLAAQPLDPVEGEDDAPRMDDEAPTDSQPGGVYELGPHRLVCGDATDPEAWAALLRGEPARALWTDPPYGVGYVGGTKDALTLANDDLDAHALQALLGSAFGLAAQHCRPGAPWYVAAPAGPRFHAFGTVLLELGVWRQTLVWLKDRFALGTTDFQYAHEELLYGWVPGAAHYFVEDRTHDSVIEVPRPNANREHPTMKPVELIRRCLAVSTRPGWTVLDPFAGSGSTLIAAASMGRAGRAIEIDPRYCDVIRRRWHQWATGASVDPGPGALP